MKGKSKRIFSGATAIIAALAILTSGALAWYAGTTAINKFTGTMEAQTNPMANLHDDFADPSEGGEIDKNIYVENTGDDNVFVRIKLSEILTIEGDVATAVHKLTLEEDGVTSKSKLNGNFVWTMGNAAEGEYNYTSIKDGEDLNWDGLTPNEKVALVADGLGHAKVDENGVKVDLTAGENEEKTLATDVITMAAYNDLSNAAKTAYVGWIYDVDGYAYWSKPLAKGEVTGLLLSAVTVPKAGTMDYEYDIIVDMEFVDITDIGAWIYGDPIKESFKAGATTERASNDAQKLLKAIGRVIPTEVGEIYIDNNNIGWIVLTKDEDGNVLMTTISTHGNTIFHSSNNNYVGSDLKSAMQSFTASLADDLSTRMKGVDIKENELDWDGVGDYGLSVVNGAKDRTAFALSKQEVEEYIISNEELVDSIDGWYWLRTKTEWSYRAAAVDLGGNVNYNFVANEHAGDYGIGVRPALWISTQ